MFNFRERDGISSVVRPDSAGIADTTPRLSCCTRHVCKTFESAKGTRNS